MWSQIINPGCLVQWWKEIGAMYFSSFSFCRLENKMPWELNRSVQPLFLFLLNTSCKRDRLPFPWLWVPSGAVLLSECHMWLDFFAPSPKVFPKSELIFLHRCCVIPGASDRCCFVEVDLTGISCQESEVIGGTIKQLLISLSKWRGSRTAVESRPLGPQTNCLD